jgi:hypothetical protein
MSNPVEIVANELPGLGEFDAYEREQAARAVLSALEKAGI